MTQLLMTTSTDSAGSGMSSMWPAHELDVRGAGLGGVALGEGEHLVGHVEADRAAGRTDPLGRQQHVDAAARAEVEDALAFVELRDGDRVAAAERGEDGRIGQLVALERGVELAADLSGVAGAAAAVAGLDGRGGVAGADLFVDRLGGHAGGLLGQASLDVDIDTCRYR